MEEVCKWCGSLRSNRFHDAGFSNYNAESMPVKARPVHRLRGEFLDPLKAVSFSRRTVLHGVSK
jgi:hypothetical protein